MNQIASIPYAGKIFAIGDIHGDLDALLRILAGLNLIDAQGDWIGGSSTLVMMGDLVDRGPDSFAVVNHVMTLENQATLAGGQVFCLLGNHELLVTTRDFRFIRGREVLELENVWIEDHHGLDAIFRGNSIWASWIRKRPTCLKIGDSIFVHAGIDKWALEWDFDSLNEALQAWIAHFQGVAPEPAEETFWLTAEIGAGPIWNRAFVARSTDAAVDPSLPVLIEQVLAKHQAKRLVLGHSPTKNTGYQIAWPHPQLGHQVALIDTGISMVIGGRLSALMMDGDHLEPRYFERGTELLPLTVTLRRHYLNQLDQYR